MRATGWRFSAIVPVLAVTAVAASSCGSHPVSTRAATTATAARAGSSTSASPVAQRASHDLLYAVLESHGQASNGPPAYDTVAIAGLDGYARAKTTFTPMTAPYVGCLGPLLPLQAHTAAGRVFFMDGKGVVRSLGLDRTVKQVATFAIGTQQEASFAVSPDGNHLLGTVLTIPPKGSTDACSTQGNGFAPGDWSQDVYAADRGGAARLISHRSWPQSTSQQYDILSLVGWDQLGPIGTSPTGYGTQGGGPVHEGWYGRAVRVDAGTGGIQRRLGNDSDNCFVDDVAPDGSYVCSPDGIDVFNADGSVAWKYSAPNQGYMVPLLSPDARRVEALGPLVVGKDGQSTTIGSSANAGSPSTFFASGWLDNQTLIGWHGQGTAYNEMTVVRLSAASQLVDLGFQGTFVGVVQAG